MDNLYLLAANTSVDMKTVVIAGVVIVMVVLAVLVVVFKVFGLVVSKSERTAKHMHDEAKPAPVAVASASAPAPAAPVVSGGIPGEVIAAITAAVIAAEGPGAVVRSVRRAQPTGGRKAWAMAGIADNTRAF